MFDAILTILLHPQDWFKDGKKTARFIIGIVIIFIVFILASLLEFL